MLLLALHDFLSLVDAGALPQPVFLGKHQLWIVSEIEAVLTGRCRARGVCRMRRPNLLYLEFQTVKGKTYIYFRKGQFPQTIA